MARRRPPEPPPRDEAQLLYRARTLAGRTVDWVAETFDDQQRALERAGRKGRTGALLEAALGADASSKAEPDFVGLGIELKTIPVDATARPLETTWVCVAPVDGRLETAWENSWARRKLARVLWVPIVGDRGSPPGGRKLGSPILWSPSEEEEAVLRTDYEELSELIATGRWDLIDGTLGDALHLRPKAASSRELTPALNEDGEWIEVNPRGFYLRRSFTGAILAAEFGPR